MKKMLFVAILLSAILATCLPAFTATKTFIKEYAYLASENDSKNSSRTLAVREVKRLLLEELGTYLESETEVKDFRLTKDQVSTFTAGIVSVEIIDEKWDGRTYWLKSKVAADPDEIARSIDTLRRDRVKTKELAGAKKRSEDYLNEIERLKKELTAAKGERRDEIQAAYDANINGLSASDWFEKGLALHHAEKHRAAIDAYDSAIALNPKFADAYFNRGNVYSQLGQRKQAIASYDKAIEINPEDADAYFNRGNSYKAMGSKKRAIEDYTKALEINPEDAEAYYNRGNAYSEIGNRKRAIADYTKAIEINPEDPEVYYNRGNTYSELGNEKRAIQDFKAAARLGDKEAKDLLREKGINW